MNEGVVGRDVPCTKVYDGVFGSSGCASLAGRLLSLPRRQLPRPGPFFFSGGARAEGESLNDGSALGSSKSLIRLLMFVLGEGLGARFTAAKEVDEVTAAAAAGTGEGERV